MQMLTDFPVICLMGPTASGKTALALDLVATGLPLEIISVDSALVYRDMNIGTAKPSQAELTRVPHHLIDIRDPTQHYSVGDFIADTTKLIPAIHARAKVPLLVGGTMLYFKALQQGMAILPKQNADIRAEIEHEAQQQGWPALHAKLMQIDPIVGQKINPADSQRIQRALEVYRLTGKPLSEFHADSPGTLPACCKTFAIFPEDRSLLHQRIALRTQAMLQTGFIDEVIFLRTKYDLTPDLPAMRAVGYRQVCQYLDGYILKDKLHDHILFATRQYAKRQLTWLKSWGNLTSVDLKDLQKIKSAIELILKRF